MNAKQLVYVGIILGILYLLYQCYKPDIQSHIFPQKQQLPESFQQVIINDPYLQPLELKSFKNVTEIINRDALDTIVFNKLKNRRNVVYSSYGLRNALLLTYVGSKQNSDNWKSLRKVFGTDDKLALAYHRDLHKYLVNTGKIRAATGIWYDNQALQLTPYYQKQIACISGCHTNISKDSYEDTIAILTEGDIGSFEYESIDETLLIINAMFFEFNIRTDPKKSYIDRFVSWDGHETEVKYMNNIANYLYVIDTSAQALLINYDSPFSLLIILPKNGEEPEPMTRRDINKTISMMKKTKIDLYLPRIEYENVHQLVEPLEIAGFSYITKSSYDRATLNPTFTPTVQIVQKTKVRIVEDESYTNMVNLDTDETLPKVFKADHSFLYYFIYMPTKECIISGIFNSL